MTGVSGRRALLALGWLLGAVGGAAASLGLFMVDDTCPQYADQGAMAAPHSAYTRVMCFPDTQEPPFVLVVALAAVLSLLALLWWLRRTPVAWSRTLAHGLILLVVPALVVGFLHLTLPRDCLGGRAESGNCSRDREAR